MEASPARAIDTSHARVAVSSPAAMSASNHPMMGELRPEASEQEQLADGAELLLGVGAPLMDSTWSLHGESLPDSGIGLDHPSLSPLFTFLTDDGRPETPRDPPPLHPPSTFPPVHLEVSTDPPPIGENLRRGNTVVETTPGAAGSTSAGGSISLPSAPISSSAQIEEIAPWSVISFFLKLYLQYMHSLFPVVHKPTFFQAVALRTDQTDRRMRALILALGERCGFQAADLSGIHHRPSSS